MKSLYLIALFSILTLFSCKKDTTPQISIQSNLGCVDDTQITNIPYLTTISEMMAAISIDDNTCDYNIYQSDGVTLASELESNYLLIVKKENQVIKQYKLLKQSLSGEIIINDTGTSFSINSKCGNKSTSKPTAVTYFFNAIKDSTYAIYVRNGDSAGGVGFISVTDSLENEYLTDVVSGTNAGSGCQGEPCDDSNIYSFTSNLTGRIFIECYGVHYSPDDYHYLNTIMTLWVKN